MKIGLMVLLGLLVGAALMLKDKDIQLGGQKIPKDCPLLGRWDQVGKDGYIRFTDYGWFRSELNGKPMEGGFQLCSGSAVEFSVTWDVTDLATKKKSTKTEIWESKYSLKGDELKLQIKNDVFLFKKAQ